MVLRQKENDTPKSSIVSLTGVLRSVINSNKLERKYKEEKILEIYDTYLNLRRMGKKRYAKILLSQLKNISDDIDRSLHTIFVGTLNDIEVIKYDPKHIRTLSDKIHKAFV